MPITSLEALNESEPSFGWWTLHGARNHGAFGGIHNPVTYSSSGTARFIQFFTFLK